MLTLFLIGGAIFGGCAIFGSGKSDSGGSAADTQADTDADTDTDTDADADADADADSDADADGDSDADTDADFCELSLAEDAPAGPDCVTENVGCGDEIEATTAGGSSAFVGEDYTSWFCFTNVESHAYDGSERVYAIDLAETDIAHVTLESPCDDVDLAVVSWTPEDTCPTSAANLSTCEGGDREGGDSARLDGDIGARWLIIVEPKRGEDTNFRLRIECE